jgi:hypothetical protein
MILGLLLSPSVDSGMITLLFLSALIVAGLLVVFFLAPICPVTARGLEALDFPSLPLFLLT